MAVNDQWVGCQGISLRLVRIIWAIINADHVVAK